MFSFLRRVHQDSGANAYVGTLKVSADGKMGLLHALYGSFSCSFPSLPKIIFAGVGAFCSPLAATSFSQMKHWSFQYLISLGLSCINLCAVGLVFRFRTLDGELSHKQGYDRSRLFM